MAVTTRAKDTASTELEQLRAEIAGLRAALQTTARIAAQATAKAATGPWTDYAKLLQGQFSVSPADVELFLAILRGDKP
jgi:hypothetical protein